MSVNARGFLAFSRQDADFLELLVAMVTKG